MTTINSPEVLLKFSPEIYVSTKASFIIFDKNNSSNSGKVYQRSSVPKDWNHAIDHCQWRIYLLSGDEIAEVATKNGCRHEHVT